MNLLLLLLTLTSLATAQFFNFGNMFGQQQQHQEPQNMPSDSEWYQQQYESGEPPSSHLIDSLDMLMVRVARCDKYLCPHTLSCVHFPHHCPCAFPEQEDKVEFGEGSMVCVSKGGFKVGEAQRKIDLARKGLL